MRDDKARKNKGSSYYDGHYPEPEMTLEEIEKIIEEEKKKVEQMTEWEYIYLGFILIAFMIVNDIRIKVKSKRAYLQ